MNRLPIYMMEYDPSIKGEILPYHNMHESRGYNQAQKDKFHLIPLLSSVESRLSEKLKEDQQTSGKAGRDASQ